MIPTFLLTVDVEDWFQVENFKEYIPFSSWGGFDLRVERNTRVVLDILDGIRDRRGAPARATFFVLGWVAQKVPALVHDIRQRGHEVASHGFHHALPTRLGPAERLRDMTESRSLLEDLTGTRVLGYRAPSFAVTPEVLQEIRQAGYAYDASYNSFDVHPRYGRMDLSSCAKAGIARLLSNGLCELPVSNLPAGRRVLPWGGGGYFRLLPLALFKAGVRRILQKDDAYLFYMHPWEIDPGQPRVSQASLGYRFRHYVGMKGAERKLRGLMGAFSGCRFLTCSAYLERNAAPCLS